MYENSNQESTRVIGSFYEERNTGFKDSVSYLMENFKEAYQLDVFGDFKKIMENDVLAEQYKAELLGDVLNEQFEDKYMSLLPDKLEQLHENSRLNILEENYGVAQLSPIVGYSLPILKKNFLECHGKDIVMTTVPPKPIIKAAFERKFLKNKKGEKFYIPEIFYNEDYKEVSQMAKGKVVNDGWFPQDANLPVQDLPIMNLSGGTLEARDTLSLDFHIKAVKMTIDGTETIIDGLDIKPDLGSNNSFVYKVKHTTDAGTTVEEIISGQVDFYAGNVSVMTSGDKITKVQFGGHLSNQNNTESLELDKERETMTWMIGEAERLNTGITIEKIRDMKALDNRDITPEIISDMSTVLTQFEDSSIISYLKESLNTWKDKKELPFGYTDGFVETAKFDCMPDHGMLTQSDWIEKELKFRLDRLTSKLKNKLKTEAIMFVIFANPEIIELLNPAVKWIVNEDTRVGGVQLEYRFGVMNTTKGRMHVVSSLKVDVSEGIRVVAYPTTDEHITFKHYKYSLNIENTYRNPNTPLTPNIMSASRHLTTSVLPIQGQVSLENSDFGIVPRTRIKKK